METSMTLRLRRRATLTFIMVWTLLTTMVSSQNQNQNQEGSDLTSMRERYERWLTKHGQRYRSRDEWEFRFGIYQSNIALINFVNSQNLSYKLTDNRFADMTNSEFAARHLGRLRTGNIPHTKFRYDDDRQDLPTTVDWRKSGTVTPITDQGRCGACWAFAAVAAVEGLHKIKNGKLVKLSEQELVDCDVNTGNEGCRGGFMENAFSYIKIYGITTEENYPYKGSDGTCNQVKQKNQAVNITGYETVPKNKEKSLQAAVAHQPVAVAVDAGGFAFQLYSSGIFRGLCGKNLNHGVTAVGYGEEDGKKYWIVKNSWGTEWGESGYIRLKRDSGNKEGSCGIAMMASYPVMA